MVEPTQSVTTAQADESSLRHLLWGLPAVFACAAIAIVAGAAAMVPNSRLIHLYSETARLRLKQEDFQGARECYLRLQQLAADETEVQFGLAATEWGLGRHEKAVKMMTELGPPDRSGYPPAHLWWARRFLVAGSESSSLPALQNAEVHLRRALEQQPDNADARALLGQLCLGTGRAQEAEEHLRAAVRVYPQLRLQLARAFDALGKTDLARAEAETALAYFQRLLNSQRENHAARKECARIALFLKDFSTAVTLLKEGLVRSGNEGYPAALAAVYAAWAAHLANQPDPSPEAAVTPLLQGLQYDPANEQLLQQLLSSAQENATVLQRVKAALQASGGGMATLPAFHLLQAVEHHRQNELDAARQQYELAYRAAPHIAVIANNLAWLLAHSEPVDLDRALTLATAAVERAPQNIDYRDTRGRILIQLQRWSEARSELEAILAVRPNHPETQRLLNQVYEQLGLPELAGQTKQPASE